MNDDDVTVINAADPELLTRRVKATHLVASDLVSSVLSALPSVTLQRLQRLLDGGAAVGIEAMSDARAMRTLRLIAIEREGARHVIANVTSNQPSAGAH